MKKLTDKITFRNGGTITNRLLQSPMLTNSGLDQLQIRYSFTWTHQSQH
mgnify:CR=1 FL=1